MLAPRRAVGRNLRCGSERVAARKGLALSVVTSVDRLCQRLAPDSECQPNSLRALRGRSLRKLAARLIVGSNVCYGAQQYLKCNLESGTFSTLTYNSRQSATSGVACDRKASRVNS